MTKLPGCSGSSVAVESSEPSDDGLGAAESVPVAETPAETLPNTKDPVVAAVAEDEAEIEVATEEEAEDDDEVGLADELVLVVLVVGATQVDDVDVTGGCDTT